MAEAAEVLGTSPQTIRTMLRTGELRGSQRAWGSRFVWEVDRDSVVALLDEFGKFNGRRRKPRPARDDPPRTAIAPGPAPAEAVPEAMEPTDTSRHIDTAPKTSGSQDADFMQWSPAEPQRPRSSEDHRRLLLRPRFRALTIVVLLGLPALCAYAVARVMPTALWYAEVDQQEAFRTQLTAQFALHAFVLVLTCAVIGANFAASFLGSQTPRSRSRTIATAAATLGISNIFATQAASHWQIVALWLQREPFGVEDPIHGKDVSFFVFALPLHLELNHLLMWLIGVAALCAGVVRILTGELTLKPLSASLGTRYHVGVLLGLLLLTVAWRLHLERYLLELAQPEPGSRAFAGANYVDITVRYPLLQGLEAIGVVVGLLLLLSPLLRVQVRPRARPALAATAGLLVTAVALTTTVAPGLVQRYVVDPNPLLSEQEPLDSSIAATRQGLGLGDVTVGEYQPDETLQPADYAETRQRLDRVATWDTFVLEARMRELVADPPYYRPDAPTLDVRNVDGSPQLTVVSARELDLDSDILTSGNWSNERLAYTHGLGLVRISATDVDAGRQPRVLDPGGNVRQPRLYYGNLDAGSEPGSTDEDDTGHAEGQGLHLLTPVLNDRIADPAWALANTGRAEVDFPATSTRSSAPYHYDGSGGIALSDWSRRLVFALALGSKELVLSDDISPSSRLLMHRDVGDRVELLAPFVSWDVPSPVQTRGGVVYLAQGTTTSDMFPYAERVDLKGESVNYARSSVVATVNAFSGDVSMYVTDPAEPLIRAWQSLYPTLLRPLEEMPADLRSQLRYPTSLFEAQASAYERFHDTDPSAFASESDSWVRPLALSGPIEVAGDVDFDEDDEDDLRFRLETSTIYSIPPGEDSARLVRQTYFSPSRGQNLVASLSAWVDQDGHAHLESKRLSRDSVTLGPAQVSRLVFAQPRVRNLLGLRNLEIRDLQASSLDSVLLGRPRILLTPQGVIQLQSLYEGSRGAGAARLLGVTAFLNGRAGLGTDIQSAVRQALNRPPRVRVLPTTTPVLVGRPVPVSFHVQNARREVVSIRTVSGQRYVRRPRVVDGRGTITWVPREWDRPESRWWPGAWTALVSRLSRA